MKGKILVVCVLGVLLAFSGVANAMYISGTGVFGNDAQVAQLHAPGAAWSFSFQLPNTIASNPTSEISNFQYTLAGSPVIATPLSIVFFPFDFGGMFNMLFADDFLGFFGADIGSNLTLLPGVYAVTMPDDSGTGTVTVSETAPVPEPSTLLLLGAGLLGLGLVRRRAQR
jgi:hypothetical protein